jgi:hypothetical protein
MLGTVDTHLGWPGLQPGQEMSDRVAASPARFKGDDTLAIWMAVESMFRRRSGIGSVSGRVLCWRPPVWETQA